MRRKTVVRSLAFGVLLAAAWQSQALGHDGEGSAEIAFYKVDGNVVSGTDIAVPADARGTWALTFTVGANGMATGGGFRIKRKGEWDFRLGTVKQTENPRGEDYVTAHCSVADVTVEIAHIGRYFKDMHEGTLRLTHGTLKEGDQITLVVGDRRQGGPGTVAIPHAHDDRILRIESDTDGDGEFAPLVPDLEVSVTAALAVRFEVVASSIIAVGEPFDLLIRAEDHNCNLDRTFNETVRLECTDPKAEMPATVDLTPQNRGVTRVSCRLVSPGFHRIKASCVPRNRPSTGVIIPAIPVIGLSNPVEVVREEPKYRLYWGDLHVHTYESDGTDTLEENYTYARDVAGLDFCAITDHLVPREDERWLSGIFLWRVESGFHAPVTVEEWWRGMMDAADRFNRPGEFVTFHGYEWSGGSSIGGDHNLIRADRAPLVIDRDLNQVYAALREADRGDNLLINPHVGGRPGNWDWHDPQVEPVAEICSVHGHFEWFGQQALQRGHRVGFIGGGDNHQGRPANAIWQRHGRMGFNRMERGTGKRTYTVPGGFAGVYATELSRKAILAAIRARRCFATTGRRIRVDFRADGHVMGEEYSTEEFPTLSWRVAGTAPLERVDLIRNQSRLYTQWADRRLIIPGSFQDRHCPEGTNYYYIRVTQEDGELAWSSPIWVDCAKGAAGEEAAPKPAWNDDGSREQILARSARHREADLTAEAARALEIRAPGRFVDLLQERTVFNVRGRYVVFLGYDRESEMAPVHIRYYPDFNEERFAIYRGWGDYGPTP